MAISWIRKGTIVSTKEQLKAEIARWTAIMKVKPTQIRVQSMKKKWASCSNRGWVCFSTDLLLESGAFQKYVIIHELLHLQLPNHGKLFKSLMNAYLPGWEAFLSARNRSEARGLAMESTFGVKIEKRETAEQKPA